MVSITRIFQNFKTRISCMKIRINRIKNKLLVEFRRELHSYNTIENVFQWLADYCIVLPPDFDDVINKSKVPLKRKLFYCTNFAVQPYDSNQALNFYIIEHYINLLDDFRFLSYVLKFIMYFFR